MIGGMVRKLTFDARGIQREVARKERRVLMRFGAFTMRRMRQLIRKRKRPAAEGKPPSSHAGTLKQFIRFAYEALTGSVVIGPMLLSGKVGDAPAALEGGGPSEMLVAGRRKTIDIDAHPFAEPAFQAELPGVPDMWARL